MNRISWYIFYLCSSVLAVTLFSGTAFCQRGILAFGDSLTEGCYIDYTTDFGHVGGFAYWNKLQALLVDNNFNITVFNHGKGGEVTRDGVNRLRLRLSENSCEREIEYVLIMEGTNDLLHQYDLDTILFNLEAMINTTRDANIEPLIATIPPDPDHPFKDIEKLNAGIRLLAAEMDVTLVEQYNVLAPQWGSYTPGCYNPRDRVHPNRVGFDVIGTIWYESLYPFLKPKLNPAIQLLLLSDTE